MATETSWPILPQWRQQRQRAETVFAEFRRIWNSIVPEHLASVDSVLLADYIFYSNKIEGADVDFRTTQRLLQEANEQEMNA